MPATLVASAPGGSRRSGVALRTGRARVALGSGCPVRAGPAGGELPGLEIACEQRAVLDLGGPDGVRLELARLEREQQQAGEHDRAELLQRELELRHDAEVAPAAADRPEQIWVPVRARSHHAAIGEHDFGADEAVTSELVLGRGPAIAACDHSGAAVDHAVEDQPGVLVAGIASDEEVAREPLAKSR